MVDVLAVSGWCNLTLASSLDPPCPRRLMGAPAPRASTCRPLGLAPKCLGTPEGPQVAPQSVPVAKLPHLWAACERPVRGLLGAWSPLAACTLPS